MMNREFLEILFSDIDDIHEGTDDEVTQELEKMGVDIEKAKISFNKVIEKYRKNRSKMMNNHEFRCKQLESEIERLKDDFNHVDNECTRLEKIDRKLWNKIAELEKQIESMRNCFNCENFGSAMGDRDGFVGIYCYLTRKTLELYNEDPICKHWKPKETK